MNKCVDCDTYSIIKKYNADVNNELLFYSRGGYGRIPLNYGRIPLNYCPTCGKSLHDDENKNAGDKNE